MNSRSICDGHTVTSTKERDRVLAGNGTTRDEAGDKVSASIGEAKDRLHVMTRRIRRISKDNGDLAGQR